MQSPIDSVENMKESRIAVLGGCGGIGRDLVTLAQHRGARIAVLDLQASLDRHPVPEGVLGIAVNATDADSLASAFLQLDTQWGALDGFVNLCGFMHDNQPSANMPTAVWNESIDGNLNSTFLAAQAAMPLLAKGISSSMVHASSGLGQHIRPGFGAYAVAKAGVIALTKTLALENAPNVRVNAVAPSAVDTAFLRGGTGRSEENNDLQMDLDAYVNVIPMKRIATPIDIVEPILFLLGRGSAYMTGQVLWINGGAYMP
jgi:NAD(P)-dependent dehydrogenase (short-subunit alcohol dehydrogenase family)